MLCSKRRDNNGDRALSISDYEATLCIDPNHTYARDRLQRLRP